MLPFYFLKKTGIYDVHMDGVIVKTRVADQAALVDTGIDELKTELPKMKPPVIGLDVKEYSGFAILLIHKTGSRCLIVHLKYLDSATESLLGFLNDQFICFVGVRMGRKINYFQNSYMRLRSPVVCKSGIEVGDLAARILKKSNLSSSGLLDIASEIGILNEVKPALQVGLGSGSGSSSLNWNARFFSQEEVEHAIQEANIAYKVGRQLLSMI